VNDFLLLIGYAGFILSGWTFCKIFTAGPIARFNLSRKARQQTRLDVFLILALNVPTLRCTELPP